MLLSFQESLGESVATGNGAGQSMRKKLRKTLPYVVAIFIGTLAAALIAGAAIMAHS
jgi:prepilin signal peptidase PulO-like enzyme (type II secretory pathway)